MSVLLRELKRRHRKEASVLEAEGFRTDSEIQSLTREDLHELFPGRENLRLRKSIYEIIHKEKSIDVILTELKGFLPHESVVAALTSNGVLVEYLRILNDMKTQMNHVQNFLDAHIGLLEEYAKDQQQEPNKGSSSPVVPSKSPTQRHPDSDQGSSGPVVASGRQNVGHLHRDQGSSAPVVTSGSSGPAVASGSPTQAHLYRYQEASVERCTSGSSGSYVVSGSPTQAHLYRYRGSSGPVVTSGSSGPVVTSGSSAPVVTSGSSGSYVVSGSPTQAHVYRYQEASVERCTSGSSGSYVVSGSPTQAHQDRDQGDWSEHDCQEDLLAVRYQVVLGGKTFGADDQLLNKVKAKGQESFFHKERFWFKESDEDCQVIIVFCPISSRIESDVKAAMRHVKGDKPVILVLMHHRRDAMTPIRTTLGPECQNVVLQVNTFYHETVPGLLKCKQNNDAAAEIEKTLLKYSIQE